MYETIDPDAAERRVLCLAPMAPRANGADGGSRVMAETLTALSERSRFALAYLQDGDEPADERLRRRCEAVIAVPLSHAMNRWNRHARRLRFGVQLIAGTPPWAARCWSPAFATAVGELIATWKPHVIQFEYHVMGQYVRAAAASSARRVLVQYETAAAASPPSEVERRGGAELLRRSLEPWAWRRYEGRILRQMDAVVVFTERDERNTRAVTDRTSVVRIPFSLRAPATPLSATGADRPNLLFIGNFAHPPNVDAAVRLATDIFPGIRHVHPDATLTLVGPSPPPAVNALASHAVTVTGRVADVTPYLNDASVVVVPIRLGGGMRVKVVEALGAGKAVVASHRAVEGLTLPPDPPLVIVDRDAEIVSATLQLLRDVSRRRDLGERAREWILQSPSVTDRVGAYEQLHTELLARTSRVPRRDGLLS